MEKRRVRKDWRKNNGKTRNNREKESPKGQRNVGQRVTIKWCIMGRRRRATPKKEKMRRRKTKKK